MITSAEWLNSTRAVGLLAYGTASTCCFVAWMRARSRREDGHLALLLMLIESTLLLDMAFNWRWMLHQLLMDLAQHAHEYAVRRTPQVIVLIVLVVLLLIGLRAVRRLSRGRGIALALSGAVLSLALWCTEVISLHQVDHVMYHRLGPIMTVSLLWMVACLMTSTGILMASREAMPAHKYV
jgi:hypothetical protein